MRISLEFQYTTILREEDVTLAVEAEASTQALGDGSDVEVEVTSLRNTETGEPVDYYDLFEDARSMIHSKAARLASR